ncbi:unnamed protein product [Amoebophrya sp. A25]|nr:unnamed protein product [Amoebophrya sp. A25]|eukprot:GSA25T00002757001.1
MNTELELAQELHGHEKAVRCMTTLKNGNILTGGVDALVCMWKAVYDEGTKKLKHFDLEKRLHHHSDFVYSLCDGVGDEYFYSGGKEKTIFKMGYDGLRQLQFFGHEGAVCSLAERGEELFSGSWDGTLRIWHTQTGAQVRKIDAGTHAITLCLLPTGEIATGSQEATIKIWKSDGSLIRTLEGHTDIVRKILYNPTATCLMSCSNDAMIKFWSLDGLEMTQLQGHESFVFDICLASGNQTSSDFPNKLFSGADDRMLKVWNLDNTAAAPLQSILHANTIWAVSSLANGDVATACADGVVRVWTTESDRFATEELRAKMSSEAVSAAAEASKQGAAGVSLKDVADVSDMPKTRGKKNGEIKMFKTGSTINAYSWNGREWDLIGEVTGRPRTAYEGDQFFPAGEYDYVFDVEVGEGGRTAKLPYNEGDNQLVTGEKFCAREGIHKSMLEQITQFLRQQTGSAGGANRAPTLEQRAGNGHTPAQNGGTTGSSTSSSAPSRPKMKHFPVDQAQYFDQGKLEAAQAKILEFNAEFEDGNTEMKMDTIDIQHFEEAIKKLGSRASKDFRPIERDLIWKKCGSWPEEKLFPVVDVWRLFLLHPGSADIFKGTDRGYSYISFVLKLLKKNLKTPLGISCARWLANVFASFTARSVLFDKRGFLIEGLHEIAQGCDGDAMHKLVKLSLATCLMNLSMVFVDRKDLKGRSELLDLFAFYLSGPLGGAAKPEDGEAVYRILVGVGNFLFDQSVKLSYDFAGKLAQVVSGCGAKASEAKVKEICADLTKLGPEVQGGEDNGKLTG